MPAQRTSQDLALLTQLTNELHAATAYIVEHGKIEIGTPQSRRMIEAVQSAKRQAGIEPRVPSDYPMAADEIASANKAEAEAKANDEEGIG